MPKFSYSIIENKAVILNHKDGSTSRQKAFEVLCATVSIDGDLYDFADKYDYDDICYEYHFDKMAKAAFLRLKKE